LIAENLKQVQQRIFKAAKRVGRDPAGVKLLAVTKEQSILTVTEGIESGMHFLGENKVQEARDKIETLGRNSLEWHFIGRLQKNKVKFIFDLFDLIHSVDNLVLAEVIHEKAKSHGSCMPVLLQVNVSGETSKLGMKPTDVPKNIEILSQLEGIKVKGFMTIAPYDSNPQNSREHYACLRVLRDTCSKLGLPGMDLGELSMGMSNDYEVAVEEGATLVRIGTGLFGPRPSKQKDASG
jgi:hypothetical protein